MKKKTAVKAPGRPATQTRERGEAYKRGISMGEDFIQGFEPDQAAEAISGFIDAVNERLLNARDKGTNITINAEAALEVLRAGANV